MKKKHAKKQLLFLQNRGTITVRNFCEGNKSW